MPERKGRRDRRRRGAVRKRGRGREREEVGDRNNTEQRPREPRGSEKSYWKEAEREQEGKRMGIVKGKLTQAPSYVLAPLPLSSKPLSLTHHWP